MSGGEFGGGEDRTRHAFWYTQVSFEREIDTPRIINKTNGDRKLIGFDMVAAVRTE